MIITISGAQGQGKTTVLNTLRERGHSVVQNKTARSILDMWDVTLDEVYSSHQLTKDFHLAIVNAHNSVCSQYKESEELIFIERSYADIFSYALAVLGPFNQHSSWLNAFHDTCQDMQKVFECGFYLSGRDYIPETDGVRSTNTHFTSLIDTSIRKYMKTFSEANAKSHMVFDINSPINDLRVQRIEHILDIYFKD